MHSMLQPGVLCTTHHCTAAIKSACVPMVPVFSQSLMILRCSVWLAYRRLKSIFRRCLAACAKCTVHPEEIQKCASAWGLMQLKIGRKKPALFSHQTQTSRIGGGKKCQLIPQKKYPDTRKFQSSCIQNVSIVFIQF